MPRRSASRALRRGGTPRSRCDSDQPHGHCSAGLTRQRARTSATRSSTCTSAARSRPSPRWPLTGPEELSLAYTPGVARVCEAIAEDPSLTQHYTWVPNTVAVVTDGTAVLGLGDIGPARRDAGDGGQGGAVQAVRRRRRRADLPRHHRHRGDRRDRRPARAELRRDQPRGHLGAALLRDRGAGSRSGCRSRSSTTTSTAPPSSCWPRSATRCACTGRDPATTRVVVQGAGAAGVAVARILLEAGIRDLAVARPQGRAQHRALRPDRGQGGARPRHRRPLRPSAASLADVMDGADVYIGVSGGTVPEEVGGVDGRRRDHLRPGQPARPRCTPTSRTGTRAVVATGRSDFPNQINNVLAFPGIFRGRLRRARHRDHRGDEARRRRRARRLVGDAARRGVRSCRRRSTPAWRPGGRRGGRRGRTPGRRRPPLSPAPRVGSGACAPSTPSPSRHRRPARRPGGRGAPRARGARRVDDGHRAGRSSLNHHDLWSLRGVGLRRGAAADDPRLRRRRHRRGRQRGRRPRGDQRPGLAGDETLDPRRSLLSERHPGTFAERVAVPRRNLLPKPAALSFEEAACLPTAWLTAYRMLFNRGGLDGGRHRAGAGRRRRRGHRADRAGPRRRAEGAGHQPRRGQAGQGARARRARGLRVRRPAARSRSTR